MRSFIITLILFFTVISIIAINSLYIQETTDTLILYANDEEFKKAPTDALERLESFWDKNRLLIEFSVSCKEVDRMSELILDLGECIKASNTDEATRIRALIADCAKDISRLERISIENLL